MWNLDNPAVGYHTESDRSTAFFISDYKRQCKFTNVRSRVILK